MCVCVCCFVARAHTHTHYRQSDVYKVYPCACVRVCVRVRESKPQLTTLSLQFGGRLSLLSAARVSQPDALIHSADPSSICLRYNHAGDNRLPLSALADCHCFIPAAAPPPRRAPGTGSPADGQVARNATQHHEASRPRQKPSLSSSSSSGTLSGARR